MEIREAYGKYYDEFKKWIDEDGWFDGINVPNAAMGLIAQMTREIPCEFDEYNFKHRPKSLTNSQLTPTNHYIMQACIDQIEESGFEVGYIDPEFVEKFKH